MAEIQINGNSFSGNNIVINNGRVIIDGKDVTPDQKVIDIQVHGDLNSLKVDSCNTCHVNGDVHGDVSSMSGDIDIQGSTHNVKSMSGDIEIGHHVTGNASSTSGNIDIGGSLNGNASTMSGNIKHR